MKKIAILLIILLGLIPLIWFKSGYIIAKGDIFPHWFNSLNTLQYDIFTWDSINGGRISNWPMYIIFEGIWYLLLSFGIPPSVIQILFEILYFLGAGLAIYFLSSTIYRNQIIAPLISSVFYMFNFFMLLKTPNFGISWVLVFLPIVLAFYVRIVGNLKNNENASANIIGFAIITTILGSFASINPPLLVLILIAFLFIFLYYFLSESRLRIKLAKNLMLLSTLTLLINGWWIILFTQYLSSIKTGALDIGTVIDVTKWSWTHVRASLLNLFWLNGHWSWIPKYFPYADVYSNAVLRLLVFIPMLIAFSGFLFRSKYRKINTYFGLVVLLLMFLAKGLHPPLEEVNLFLYNHIPGFYLFREPFGKFYMILIIFLALLIGSAANSIAETIESSEIRNKKFFSSVSLAFIISCFIASSFPFITGEVISGKTKQLPFSSYVSIPYYWYNASTYLNSEGEDFKVLLTPNNDFYQVPYRWGYYGLDIIAFRLIGNPVLQYPYGYDVNDRYGYIVGKIYEMIERKKNHGFISLVEILSVKYVLQRNDIWWDFNNRKVTSPEKVSSFLSNQKDIHLEKTFGKLDLYKISDESFLPHICASP